MLAFRNDEALQTFYVERVTGHKKHNQIRKDCGFWQEEFQIGSAVGCTIHGDDPWLYERELGIPVQIAFVEESLFGVLPDGSAQRWPVEFIKRIRIGADLSNVWPEFAVKLFEFAARVLENADEEALQARRLKPVRETCESVTGLFRSRVASRGDWQAAAFAAGEVAAEITAHLQRTATNSRQIAVLNAIWGDREQMLQICNSCSSQHRLLGLGRDACRARSKAWAVALIADAAWHAASAYEVPAYAGHAVEDVYLACLATATATGLGNMLANHLCVVLLAA